MNEIVFGTPIGLLTVQEDGNGLCGVHRAGEREDMLGRTPLLEEARRQIEAYFAGKLCAFDLPLSMKGSAFDLMVWRALARIPYGEVRTYGALAREIGRPYGARAVGGACGRNPLLLVVPCHRVVGRNGRLTGFAAGVDAKRALLALEGREAFGERVRL